MKTLYVSDLDGTLLRKNETLSSYTIKTINALTSSGMLFSYATARSLNTAKKVTEGLNTHFPLIIYNGAFVKDNITEEILIANYFEEDVYEAISMKTCVEKRVTLGAPGPSVMEQVIAQNKEYLEKN